MRKSVYAIALVICATVVGVASAASKGRVTVANSMPVVVKTVPQSGNTEFAPGTAELRVTFSKDMQDQSWSFTEIDGVKFPEIIGKIRYLADKRTCVVKVKLEPNTTYASYLNSAKFGNFRDADGRPAQPYLLIFETASAE